MLAKVRITAQVVSQSTESLEIALTANQFEKLTKVLKFMPVIGSVTDNRLVCHVPITALASAIADGRTAGNVAREIEYTVNRRTVYDIEADDALNEVKTLTWYDENYGYVKVNGISFDIAQASAGTLLKSAPNPSRKLVYIRALVERDGTQKHVILHNGSVSGLIKRLVNYTWKIVDESLNADLAEADEDEGDDE